MNKLPFKETLIEACQIGLKNILSLIAVTVLYLVTIWIPYLNVGTTIAVNSIPAELAKGHIIDPLFIFDGKYRKNMGEFFILVGLEFMALIPAFFLGIIPAIVMGLAWCLAILLFVDKDMKALDALRKSNELTYGYKWRIFWLTFVLAFCLQIVLLIIGGIFNAIGAETFAAILSIILGILFVPFGLGLDAVIYRELTKEEAPKAEEPKAEVVVEEVIVTEE